MKKLQLDIDTISVEAFATGPSGGEARCGTVHANALTQLCTIRSDCTQPQTAECPITHDANCM